MAIKWVNDLGAPLAVTAIDIATETMSPKWNEYLAYILAVGGYVAAGMGWGGDFVKNVGISSVDWAGKKLYARMRGGVSSHSMQFRAARYPAPAPSTPYEGVKLT